MAEQSMILRPTACQPPSAAAIYPSDVSEENVYQLINEQEADDDATYIDMSGAGAPMTVLFKKTQLTDVIGAKVHCRVNSDGTNSAFEVAVLYNVTTNNYYNISSDPCVTGWADYVVDVSDSSEFMEVINQNDTIAIYFYPGNKPGSKSGMTAQASVKFTQIYLELIYDDGETTTIPLYLRENGAWTAVEGTVYQKVNGAWVESSTDVFQDGDSYQLVTV